MQRGSPRLKSEAVLICLDKLKSRALSVRTSWVAVKQEASAEKLPLRAQRKKRLTEWQTGVDAAVAAVLSNIWGGRGGRTVLFKPDWQQNHGWLKIICIPLWCIYMDANFTFVVLALYIILWLGPFSPQHVTLCNIWFKVVAYNTHNMVSS